MTKAKSNNKRKIVIADRSQNAKVKIPNLGESSHQNWYFQSVKQTRSFIFLLSKNDFCSNILKAFLNILVTSKINIQYKFR